MAFDELLGEGRKDESGDFTTGAGLRAQADRQIVVFALYKKVT